jgi:hypothetical protein
MRVKKLLPLILLAIGALFLLSSCDAILDALYANNTITVTAYVITTHPGATSYYSSVTVNLSGASGATVSAGYSGSIYHDTVNGFNYAIYYFSPIKRLPNGNYNMTSSYYDGVTTSIFSTTYFYDQNENPYTSISMPFNGSSTADFSVYL